MKNTLLDELKAAAQAVDADDEGESATEAQLNPEPVPTTSKQAEMLARLKAKAAAAAQAAPAELKVSVKGTACAPSTEPCAPVTPAAPGEQVNALQRLKQLREKNKGTATPAPVAETPAPVAETPAPVAETQAPKKAPVVETVQCSPVNNCYPPALQGFVDAIRRETIEEVLAHVRSVSKWSTK